MQREQRNKVILSTAYELSEKEHFDGLLINYRLMAAEFLFQWAKALFYWRENKLTGRKVPNDYRHDKLEELEVWPDSELCNICEGLSKLKAWSIYNQVVEYMQSHTQCQQRKKTLNYREQGKKC